MAPPPSRLAVALLVCGAAAVCSVIAVNGSKDSILAVAAWCAAQWMPMAPPHVRNRWQAFAWQHWEEARQRPIGLANEELAVVYVQEHMHDLSEYLNDTFGKEWRKRPLLMKGLWSHAQLRNSSRRFSVEGLLQEKLTVPYFTDARLQGALAPDSAAPIQAVVANITAGAPHKIGTQLFVQTYPQLIQEVAPVDIMTELFGNYFQPQHVQGTGPFQLLPALTTVPMFVANGKGAQAEAKQQPFTALHCEPIGNIAVQLSGRKQWTLIRPEYSHLVKPSASPDGRAFFASWATDYSKVPTYTAVTAAGDAMWVPTWTWHRVDYMDAAEGDDVIAIGGSLFHFRPLDFVRNNPLFAVLMIPSLVLELVGYNTQ